MNRKRIISLLIALLMILCMLPLGSVFAYADDPYTVTATPNSAEYGSVEGGGTYESGASVSLTATAYSGYTFVNWTENGGEVATSNPYEFTAGSDRELTANFVAETPVTTSYSISVSSNNAEYGSVSGGGTYESGASVSLTATASSGYTFVNWTENGGEVATSNPYEFTAGSDRTLIANFVAETPVTTSYTINVSASPAEYGSVEGGGTHESGASVSLTATAYSGYTFVNWTENGGEVATSNPYEFTAGSDRTLTANFAAATLNVDQTKVADGVAVKSGEAGSEDETKVEGGAEGGSDTKDTGETENKYTVTVNNGTISNGTDNEYAIGASVAIKANDPATGKKFKVWTGLDGLTFTSGSANTAEATFTMPDKAVTLTATYEDVDYVITVNTSAHGKIAADKTTAHYDDSVNLTITPDTGYEFTGLEVKKPDGSKVSVTNNSFEMPECNVTVSATFEPIIYTITGGANGWWIKGTLLPYTITAKRSPTDDCTGRFTGVVIDNSILPITDYTVSYGSVAVTIKPYALQRLSTGVHTVTLWFKDGTVSTFLYIWADPRYPATGDERQTNMWAALSGATLVGMGAILILGRMYGKKKKKNKD